MTYHKQVQRANAGDKPGITFYRADMAKRQESDGSGGILIREGQKKARPPMAAGVPETGKNRRCKQSAGI